MTASSSGERSSRWRFSMSAISSAVASSKRSTMAGIVSLPAILDERQRRSPAMISYWSPDGRTRIGWSTPCSLIDAASSCSVSSCQVMRGCDGFGTTFSSGSSRTAVGVRAARSLMMPELAQRVEHVASEDRARVVERRQQSEHFQFRIEPSLHGLDDLEKRGDAFECVVLRLHRDDHAVRRDERIEREQSQGRRAVDQDVCVALDDVLAELVTQGHLASDRV